MLNPALFAALTAAAASEYERTDGAPMPWPLAFLVAPLVMHRGTRDALPRDTRTHLGNWVQQHPVIHAGIGARAQSLADPVREGIRFGLRHGVLNVDDQGRLSGTLAPVPKAAAATTSGSAAGATAGSAGGAVRGVGEPGSEVGVLLAKAGMVGKWLTKLDQPATAFAMLGVAP